jgi:hypothetical protein
VFDVKDALKNRFSTNRSDSLRMMASRARPKSSNVARHTAKLLLGIPKAL